MKIYQCPDCGQTMNDPQPSSCPQCGCPSSLFTVTEQTVSSSQFLSNGGNAHEKIYYSDDKCVIGNKVWEFDGYDGYGNRCKTCYSVRNIVSVGLHKTKEWSFEERLLLIFGIITLAMIIGLVIIIALIKHMKRRDLMVITTNPLDSYTFNNVKNVAQAKKYMAPMRQCLLEN